MPFTLAHPAAALPLRRPLGRLGSLPALAAGAMVPDLPYFLPLGVTGVPSHSLSGLVWFCLPAGLACWFVYELILRPFGRALVPATIARRLGASARGEASSATHVACAAASVLVGAMTHVAWDAFTHGSGAVVKVWAVLRVPVPVFDGYAPQVFTLLQHASTLVGLGLLGLWGLRWYHGANDTKAPVAQMPGWFKCVMLTALILPSSATGVLVLWSGLGPETGAFRILQLALGRAIGSAGSVFLATLLATALAWRLGLASRLAEPQ